MRKLFNKYILPATVAMGMFASACTDNFEEINDDPNLISDEILEGDYQFVMAFYPQLARSIYFNFDNSNWRWQVQQNLNGDVFSGYMAPPTPFAANNNATHYALIWNSWPFSIAYTNVMGPANEIERNKDIINPKLYAVSLVLKVMGMHRVTDIYGPIPYSEFGSSDFAIGYDSQEEVYTAFFNELNEAIATLEADQSEIPAFSSVDDLYAGNFTQWLKFANTLKLRLAMRISNVDPATAKVQAEAAIASGTFVAGDIAQVNSDIIHPLATVAHGWGDIKIGASIESIMKGLNDPRLSVFFSPSTLEGHEGEYLGIRQGVDLPDKDGSPYTQYSTVNEAYVNANSSILLMTGAEAFFLKSEAALKGWNAGGSAKELYEAGVTESLAQHGQTAAASAYLADDTSTPSDYVDPSQADGAYDIAAVSSVTVAWDDAFTAEQQLEQIITQKWIAGFPEGMEAWAEVRRTGYPKIFPVKYNKSGGSIPDGTFINRLPYPDSEAGNNPEGYAEAVQKLGGEDTGGTPLWWQSK
ncbi:RagB/SusD family nutrient uptake outer membrane protein [Sediminitomix flava]|uniref:SusD/RagB-like outer membrane lipoprotein n=1 Tax=Sediminitomix flava TaxID=379075 RepID=A0A315ZD81_SEDFL|nr:RagB/SusD family nutrient uptake outer membrane protein [Sediminitomix flava]PWJ43262.1 SusD/RagB-like outer membrane lipoprotein [Sediminitomix flava]